MTPADSAQPQPFQIHVPQHDLHDLQQRLRRARPPDANLDIAWARGTNPEYIRDLTQYWLSSYDWRAHEARLNALPQFKARVDGAELHFVHARGRGPNPVPLLLLHGWPDSFLRFHKVIPIFTGAPGLNAGTSGSFDVVVPSLPGFGFTGPVPRREGVPPNRHDAQLLWRLMTEVLGYDRFIVAGGDGGSVLAQIMAIDHPESVIGIHVTDLGWHAFGVPGSTLSKPERKYVEACQKRARADGAYALVQRTQPRSLAAGLNDSPVGLAAWIVDRFHAWCDFDGNLESSVSRDDLLTNVMLYWVTQTIGSSMYSYYAETQSPSLSPRDYVGRPVGLALFPKDLGGVPPRTFAARTLNVQRWTEMPRGGHFAALEQPEAYALDVIEFYRLLKRRGQQHRREQSHVSPTF